MFNRDTVEQFALIHVDVGGTSVEARPCEWRKDSEGFAMEPTVFHTTCPHCSQLLPFKIEELIDGLIYCACGAGKQKWDAAFRVLKQAAEEPFQEPIAAGLMVAP